MIEIAAESAKTSSNYRAPALEKGLDVLELLAGSPAPLSLKEVATQLGRTSQELFRVLSSLVVRGYLLRDAAGRYRTSTKLFELGNSHAATQALVARAMPHMERLAAQIGESCHLSVQSLDRMLIVARAECAADVRISVRVGCSFELHRRVSGLVALARLPESWREGYWSRSEEQAEMVQQHESQLVGIRSDGYLAAPSPIIVGGQDYAAPVLGAGGSLLGVLCMSRLSRVGESVGHEVFRDAVCQCAETISQEFGTQPLESVADHD